MRVIMKNVRHGGGERSHIIYANLYCADENKLYMAATLEYCLKTIKERNLTLVKE